MIDHALQLLRQGNKFASCEQFSEADKVFCTAASLPGGKAIWKFKSRQARRQGVATAAAFLTTLAFRRLF